MIWIILDDRGDYAMGKMWENIFKCIFHGINRFKDSEKFMVSGNITSKGMDTVKPWGLGKGLSISGGRIMAKAGV